MRSHLSARIKQNGDDLVHLTRTLFRAPVKSVQDSEARFTLAFEAIKLLERQRKFENSTLQAEWRKDGITVSRNPADILRVA